MKRVRKTQAMLEMPTLKLEGGLFLPGQLGKAAQGRACAQLDADYGTPKGVTLKDEYSRAFQIACAQWRHFAAQMERADVDAASLTVDFVHELLRDAFGYVALQSAREEWAGELRYPVSLMAGRLPVLVAPHTLGLDDADPRFAVSGGGSRKKAPFVAMQELLNASESLQWGIVSNGRQLRLLRDAASLTRPSFLEVDLADLLGGERYAEFANVWRLLHASRANGEWRIARGEDNHSPLATHHSPSIWEQWRNEGLEEGVRAREGLRDGVEEALRFFGAGFLRHPANTALRAALNDGNLNKDAWFQQLLRLVYRLIFVFTVEERGLLHPQDDSPDARFARRAYAEGYALTRLRERCLKRRLRNRHDDQWQAIRIVFRALEKGEPRLALPALGGLFAPGQCPDLDAASLDNDHLLTALKHLRWASIANSFTPVDYRNMGPEELGSVYESLLELVPAIDLHARGFDFVGRAEEGSTAGNARKLTGSYYTPDSLVRQLIASALEPVIEQRLAEAGRMANSEWEALTPAYKEIFERHEQRIASGDGDANHSLLWQTTPSAIRHSLFATHALLSIRVIDPACGSGHFLLAAARRLAERLAQLRSLESGREGAVTPRDYRHALREVVACCIYGVDRNPMAIELARMALWLEGYEEGRPLSFLDHHLQVGDALLGLTDLRVLEKGIAKDAFKPLSGDDREMCGELAKANAAGLKQIARDLQGRQMLLGESGQTGLNALRAIEAMPSDTPEQVAAKEQAYRRFLEDACQSPLAQAADALLGAYLLPKTANGEWGEANEEGRVANGERRIGERKTTHQSPPRVPTTATLYLTLLGSALSADQQAALAAARDACRDARVLHWPLAFPQVFAQGGFDCVLGNPPWERIKLQEEEFFATRHRDVFDARNKAERAQRIQWLSEGMLAVHLANGDWGAANEEDDSPLATRHSPPSSQAEKRLYHEFVTARRTAEAASVFAHVKGSDGGRYPLTGMGDVNTYALFAETILQIHADSGRAGFIVPTGIATDDSTKAYFGHITQNQRLVSLYDIENREKLFPAVDSRMKFCLLTLGVAEQAEFVCFITQISQLADSRRRFTLTPDEFRLINPNTLTCPVFRSERDAELTKKLYRAAPVLTRDVVIKGEGKQAKVMEPAQNPWGISFMRMLDMANDSHLFKNESAPGRLPLYEAKLIHQFDHRWATYGANGGMANGGDDHSPLATRHSPSSRDVTVAEKASPNFTVTPRYWVEAREVWLRVARLPEDLMKALKEGNEEAIALSLTQLLFGRWLAWHPGIEPAPAWQDFARKYPYAARFTPVWLISSTSSSAAGYAVDTQALESALALATDYPHLPEPEAPLQNVADALALAERWLEAACPQWLMGWRDICRATDERTVIASVTPLVGVGNQMPLMLFPEGGNRARFALLLANLSVLVFDFVARHKTGGTHMNYFIFKQLPVLPPDRYTEADLAFIVPRVLELTYTAHDLTAWARELVSEWKAANGGMANGEGVPLAIRRSPLTPFPFDPNRRALLRAELDAWYARLYGLTRIELRYLLDPADVMGEDYPSETFRVLKEKEIRAFGEYRTQRLTLEAWDKIQKGDLH